MARAPRVSRKSASPFELIDDVPISRIFLALNNPRFEPVETEPEAIDRLLKEDVLALARDIVSHGLNPLERFAITPIGKTRSGEATYWVAEGNRRACALKLLSDPDLAPPKYRKSFEKLAETWTPLKTIAGVVFSDQDTLRVWLDRTHSGTQGGIGRKTWDADQKQRFSGSSKNALAQALLDYAEAHGMITKEERQGKLTTTQRFFNSEASQEIMGIDRSSADELRRTRPKADFDVMLRRFTRDLVEGTDVTSRMNKPDIVKYVRGLTELPGVTAARVEAEPLSVSSGGKGGKRITRKPKKPDKARHVQYDDEINQALRGLGNEKLLSFYYSICLLELEHHTPLASIGVWAFFETLTGCAGRDDGVSLDAFLTKVRLTQYGITGDDQKAVRGAIDRVRDYGNLTKHHKISAAFNGDQLNNDMTTLKQVVVGLIGAATNAG